MRHSPCFASREHWSFTRGGSCHPGGRSPPIFAAEMIPVFSTSRRTDAHFAQGNRPVSSDAVRGPAPTDGANWWAVHTLSRREKELARRLLEMRIPFYCPIIPKKGKSPSGRVRVSHVPLFSGYVFLRADHDMRTRVLMTQLVLKTLQVTEPAQFFEDLRRIRMLIESNVPSVDRIAYPAGPAGEGHQWTLAGGRGGGRPASRRRAVIGGRLVPAAGSLGRDRGLSGGGHLTLRYPLLDWHSGGIVPAPQLLGRFTSASGQR